MKIIKVSDSNPVTRGELAHVMRLLAGCFREGGDARDVAREIEDLAGDVASGDTLVETLVAE